MKNQIDVWRAACAIVSEHGSNARFFASLRADALRAQSDIDGHLLWKRIQKAIKEIQRDKPADGEWLN